MYLPKSKLLSTHAFVAILTITILGSLSPISSSWAGGGRDDIAAGTKDGGGGWVEQMREAEAQSHKAITEDEINKAVEINGKEIKIKLLTPFFQDFLTMTDLNDNTLVEIQNLLKQNESSLLDDITYSKIVIGTCSRGENLCTQAKPFSDIIVDAKSILATRNGVTFSEFVGLLAHEYTHHFGGDIDHPYYKFARFVTELVRTDKIGNRTFTFEELIKVFKNDDGVEVRYAALASYYDEKWNSEKANLICDFLGYSEATNFHTNNFTREDVISEKIGFITEKGWLVPKYNYYVYTYSVYESPSKKLYYQYYRSGRDTDAIATLFTEITCQK
jgi:hypothetical protein